MPYQVENKEQNNKIRTMQTYINNSFFDYLRKDERYSLGNTLHVRKILNHENKIVDCRLAYNAAIILIYCIWFWERVRTKPCEVCIQVNAHYQWICGVESTGVS